MESISSYLEKKKGQAIGGLGANVIALVVAIIILVIGLVIVQELRDTQTVGTEAYQAANESLVGLGTFGDFVTIIVLAVVAAVVIGLIIAGFAFRQRGR
jgi:ABC-type branched-subunit amino acid transport system permease subunit